MPTPEQIRSQILGKINAALQRTDTQDARQRNTAEIATSFQQLTQHIPSANPVNVRIDMSPAERLAHFQQMAKSSNTQVEIFSSMNDVRDFLVRHIQAHELPVYCQPGELTDAIQWPDHASTRITDNYQQTGQLGILQADCAIAETGSVVLHSGAHHPIAAGFLVDTLIALVRSEDLVLGLEDIWPVIHAKQHQQELSSAPRGVNIITGPSRTADVEQKVQLGAHGPRQLIVAFL